MIIVKIKYEHAIITATLLVLIVGIATHPEPKEHFTMLYFTNPLGIEHEVKVNEPFHVNFTVANHEFRDESYRYELLIDKKKEKENNFLLPNNASIKISENLSIDRAGNNTEVSVLLYKNNSNKAYRSIRYFLNVTGG